MSRLITPPLQVWVENMEVRCMEERLLALEKSLASYLYRSQQVHDCILDELGVCPNCEHYWFVRESFENEIMMEKDDLALFLAVQSKNRITCLCRGLEGTSLQDNIIAMALIINEQR